MFFIIKTKKRFLRNLELTSRSYENNKKQCVWSLICQCSSWNFLCLVVYFTFTDFDTWIKICKKIKCSITPSFTNLFNLSLGICPISNATHRGFLIYNTMLNMWITKYSLKIVRNIIILVGFQQMNKLSSLEPNPTVIAFTIN